MLGKYLRAGLNCAVSARVDSQMDRRISELQASIEEQQVLIETLRAHEASETARLFDVVQRMQRVITEMSTSVADRLVALEASVLSKDEE